MTTATTVELQRDTAGPAETVPPRLPAIIDGWVRDGLLSAHAAMRVFSPHVGQPDTGAQEATESRIRLMEALGYAGAGIVTLGGLLMLFNDEVGVAPRAMVGALIMIAMRHTLRPAPHLRRNDWAQSPRHRDVRRARRRNRS